jgi:membrane associated rhomboid family serine protease
VFLIGGAAGMFLAIVGNDLGFAAVGANGAALALLAAWAMRDVLGRRRGIEDDSDLLGALAVAAVLIMLPLATEQASALAGLGGGIAGVILGVLLARLPER